MIDLRNGSRLQFVDQPSEQNSIRAIAQSSKYCECKSFEYFMFYPSGLTLGHFSLLIISIILLFL